jgi:peptide/nickel transport system substrate-binding protein
VYDRIEAIEAPDDRSVVVKWKAPYIKADTGFGFPMARHRLEQAYLEEKAAFTQHPYFSREFVGVGAFKLREWVAGSHLVVEANDQFLLGRPRIDQIEVRFIPDQNTLIANILAGSIEIALGRGISVEQAMQIVDQWQPGRMDLEFTNFLALYPQFINPSPPVVASLQFRRALAHALDRSQMAEVLQWGLVPPAHSLVSAREADYPNLEPFIVKYDYDPRRAADLIQTLGYTRGGDGFFRDAGGEKLSVQLRSGATRDVSEKAILSAGDYWQQIGVASEIWITPPQLQRDREYRSTYPAFEIAQQPNDLDSLDRYHSSKTPLPENNYVVTGNRARYKSAELDSVIERYVVTIPRQERLQLTGQIIRHLTENVVHLSLFYGVEPTLMVKRLQNVHGRDTWDAYAWDLY